MTIVVHPPSLFEVAAAMNERKSRARRRLIGRGVYALRSIYRGSGIEKRYVGRNSLEFSTANSNVFVVVILFTTEMLFSADGGH